MARACGCRKEFGFYSECDEGFEQRGVAWWGFAVTEFAGLSAK